MGRKDKNPWILINCLIIFLPEFLLVMNPTREPFSISLDPLVQLNREFDGCLSVLTQESQPEGIYCTIYDISTSQFSPIISNDSSSRLKSWNWHLWEYRRR